MERSGFLDQYAKDIGIRKRIASLDSNRVLMMNEQH